MTTTPNQRSGVALGVLAMICVGSSVAVSTTIVDAPLYTLQAVRYLLATVLLVALVRLTGRRVPRPRGREWFWLTAVAISGLVVFNIGIVRGVAHAEPAVIGVAVAAVPLVLAVAGPLAAHRRPTPAVLVGAGIVTAGAVLVEGGGRTDAAGIGYALLVLVCEVGFTLLAVPVLGRLGPWGVSVHSTWIATVSLFVLGAVGEGPAAATRLTGRELLAAAHLAVVVTALAFVLWYTAVGRIGPDRAGLATGVVPVTAALGGVLLGGPLPGLAVWAGTAVVGFGLAIGTGAMRPGRGTPDARRRTAPRTSRSAAR